jgi:DNA-binding NarL/FixJ family response regulator
MKGPQALKPGSYCLECSSFDCEHFRPPLPLPPHLFAKHIAVLRGVSSGKSTKQIAYEVGLSYFTTKVYISHMMHALGLDNRVQLALWAIKHQLTETGEQKA